VREDLRSVGYDIRIERVAVGTRMVIFSTRASSMRVNSSPEARDLEHAAGS